ncbi:methylated-DNA--[protein]-cysteine S-methyltransferase [Nitrogeniibacter mangrovi]|uniref:Methylated-DNA--protein-cysteine methyltransferase n=1 Tax=Nitrogeniibacter mangrovi TaxID=2016596 RepID=A0A6C1B4P1_9RHOO|nr:methylated-DNA--[protein]-cysteine S-methyltransferase [Nitrogeniibacter mangrovi]QID18651.1 methylated-DNA--[protein]-cysteine S-methyltransferase [Nitrogeniibacter mangrovi]
MMTCDAAIRVATPLGPITLLAHGEALVAARFDAAPVDLPDSPVCREAARQLQAWFAGRRQRFELPLAPQGTPFQQAVWAQLAALGPGETLSYAQLAGALGRPRAARAVGAAVARNPLAILIPCHRVLGAGGTLTGYAWGLERKRALLRREGVDAAA